MGYTTSGVLTAFGPSSTLLPKVSPMGCSRPVGILVHDGMERLAPAEGTCQEKVPIVLQEIHLYEVGHSARPVVAREVMKLLGLIAPKAGGRRGK